MAALGTDRTIAFLKAIGIIPNPQTVATVHNFLHELDSSDISTHAAETHTHGVTGDIVGTGGAQSITGQKTFTSPILNSPTFNSSTGITAFATGGQADATALTAVFNNVSICATAGDSAKILSAAAGVIQIVKNSGVAALAVFPSSGDSIDENAADASVTVAPQEMRIFVAVDATTFHSAVMLADGSLFGGISADYLQNNVPLGTPSAGVSAFQYGDGFDVVTFLSFEDLAVGAISAGASLAIGTQIFEFPTGMHLVSTMSSMLEFTGITGVTTDTPEVGVGSVIASGAVAVLSGTAEFEDYMTGVAAVDVAGSPTRSIYVPASSIAVSNNATEKSVFLNVADAWDAGASGTLLASGTIIIKWTKMQL